MGVFLQILVYVFVKITFLHFASICFCFVQVSTLSSHSLLGFLLMKMNDTSLSQIGDNLQIDSCFHELSSCNWNTCYCFHLWNLISISKEYFILAIVVQISYSFDFVITCDMVTIIK